MDEIVRAIAGLQAAHERKVIYVCGLGGAGKTEFSNLLQQQLGQGTAIIRHDWYLTYPTLIRKERMRQAVASKDPQRIEAEENPVNWLSNDEFVHDLKQLRDAGEYSFK